MKALEFVLERYKPKKMCGKAVDIHPSTKQFVPECYKTQKMCYKTVHRCFLVSDYILDQYKTQEICDIVVSLYPFSIVHCPDKYQTQRMWDEAVENSLAALKLIPIGLLQVKCLKNLILLCTQMMVYSFLMKILVMSHFAVMKYVFLV